ncbi:MAG: hypothetical protein NVSMB64_31700 [Candidatus Velthaea sp.]
MAIELTADLQYRLTEMVVHATEVTAEIAYAGLPTRMAFTTSTVNGNPMTLQGWSLEQIAIGEDGDISWELALNLDEYDSVDWSTDGALIFMKNGHALTLSYAVGEIDASQLGEMSEN